MSDKNKIPQEEQISKLRKLSRKRWFYPAVYLCAAAIVMIGSLWIQHNMSGNQPKDNGQVAMNKGDNEAIPVNSAKEVFQWPVTDKNAVNVAVPFYDVNADADAQAAALVNYNNSYVTSKGICLVANDHKSFDVAASMSGKVVKASKDPILGNVVEIDHGDGVVTFYESLGSMAVEKGQKVSQGDVIGTAGTDKYMQDLGVHLHFELRKDGVAVDPQAYFLKGITSLDNLKASSDVTKDQNAKDQSNSDNNMNRDSNNDSNNMGSDEPKVKENNTSPDQSSTSTDSSDQMDGSNS